MPFYISAILAILGMFYFRIFWEAIIILSISDFLYGAKEVKFSNTLFISLLVSTLILILIEFLKRKMKFYNK
jgi:hypothetical protein